MSSPSPAFDALAARRRFRADARQVVRHPTVLPAHRRRLLSALALSGAEPVQGALADLFLGCADASAEEKRAALDLVRGRLGAQACSWFDAWVGRPDFPACSRMATRWSVLATASLDVPRRSLRCSSDDSRRLAQAAVAAWHRGDEAAQDEFLAHCEACKDTLAFMLARRALLRAAPDLPQRWAAACVALQAWAVTP